MNLFIASSFALVILSVTGSIFPFATPFCLLAICFAFIARVNDIKFPPKDLLVTALVILSSISDLEILYCYIMIISGLLLGRILGAKLLFVSSLPSLLFLYFGIYQRFQMPSLDPNYTAYLFFLLSAPLFFQLTVTNERSKILTAILIATPAILPMSRGVLATLVISCSIFFNNFNRFVLFFCLLLFGLAYQYLFPDRGSGSDLERIYIINQILDMNINGDETKRFDAFFVASDFRPDGLVHLHNTIATWFFKIKNNVFALVLAFLLCARIKLKSLVLLIPTLFISIPPGYFYLFFGASLGAINCSADAGKK